MASEAWLLDKTKALFQLAAEPTLEPILKGGSERAFHRVQAVGALPCILMTYSQEKEENHYYAEIGQFLAGLGINVPRILQHDAAERVLWMEDLGALDLHALRDHPWSERRIPYQRLLGMVHRLHRDGLSAWNALGPNRPRTMPGFDATLYTWERNYFLEQFVNGVCGLPFEPSEKAMVESELAQMAQRLCQARPSLVHRDFQSQNVMLRDGTPYLIDFQGMRPGTHFYDLGSLLFDPYVRFEEAEREELLRHAHALWGAEAPSWEDFQRSFYEASVQRLMQALGAYGFLGLKRGKTAFLAHIPQALKNLERAARGAGTVPHLHALLPRLTPGV